MKRIFPALLLAVLCCSCAVMPAWRPSVLEIHCIATGRGNCTFVIMPDGTTMLYDAGDLYVKEPRNARNVYCEAMPDSSLMACQWQEKYIRHTLHRAGLPEHLDYVLLSHIHLDHLGQVQPRSVIDGGIPLQGLSYLATKLGADKYVDFRYPDYDYLRQRPMKSFDGPSLRALAAWIDRRDSLGLTNETFRVGADDQFVMKRAPEKYGDFRVRNIYAAGKLPDGSEIRDTVGTGELAENSLSCAVKFSYGPFDYYTGGDVEGSTRMGDWKDVEYQAGLVAGQADVVEVSHHGAGRNTMTPWYLETIRPRVAVVHGWCSAHPRGSALGNMKEYASRSGAFDLFSTGMQPEGSDSPELLQEMVCAQGHVVVRVRPGGKSYRVFVLDPGTLKIIYRTSAIIPE